MSIRRVRLGPTLAGHKRATHRERRDSFLEDCDENGRAVFSHILQWADERAMWIHWGPTDFTVNVYLGGKPVAFCFGRPPNNEKYGQSVCLPLRDDRGIGKPRLRIHEDTIRALEEQALSTGLFRRMGRSTNAKTLKYQIEEMPTDGQVDSILDWFEAAAAAIREYGLR